MFNQKLSYTDTLWCGCKR